MNIIPKPRAIELKTGNFKIKRDTKIILTSECNFVNLEAALELQKEIETVIGFKLNITKSFSIEEHNAIYLVMGEGKAEGYEIKVTNDSIKISGNDDAGLFYGIQTLKQIIDQSTSIISGLEIKDYPSFKHRGFYHDVTRGKVPKLETLMELIDRAAFYKLNQVQLYVEHCFAFEGLSEVWVNKDPISAEEILILDKYCASKHIELVPSLSTFGHLYEVLVTKSFSNLCEIENSDKENFGFSSRMGHHT